MVPLGGKIADGRTTLVDDEDYDAVMQYRWHAMMVRRLHLLYGPYARTCLRGADGTKVFLYLHTYLTGYERTDHKDGNSLNNQRSNLRAVTHSQNMMNQRPRKNTSSRFKGVSWVKGCQKWRAYISADHKFRFLGSFDVEEEAARAYDKAARERAGEYAWLNFPDDD